MIVNEDRTLKTLGLKILPWLKLP